MTEQRASRRGPEGTGRWNIVRWQGLVLAAGILALGAAAATVALQGDASAEPAVVVFEPPAAGPKKSDPHLAGLTRCRSATDAADAACQALWDERRRRFLGGPAMAEPGSQRPLPKRQED